eukprot:TRINITY_DN11253_c0_g1_i2.p1 TRINITY_DN11253_c0_g1~~TRINITY_DN11253_c0_g1_i2.p1  ORF type:complete len:452 (-),score=74.78 TRINITY_DN11253_c0_g1_i2:100-1431(-)
MAEPGVVLDCLPTLTSQEQVKVEKDVLNCFKSFLMNVNDQDEIRLDRDLHSSWLQRGLQKLPANFCGLDASRPWFVYWISHALEVLGEYDESIWASKAASFLGQCQDPTGGFGGGPGQLPHLAPTYAAVCALVIAGSEKAYKVVDREQMYGFLMRMKSPDGGFRMHDEGETDMRGSYCALAVASMLHMLSDELVEGIPEYIRRCQTWEGGIAGEEGLEAHGGYSYCGLAALCLAGKAHALDLHAFLNWAAHKQMSLEGGFAGRANKLVDSCYSFWQGAIFPLIHEAFRQKGEDVALPSSHAWFSPSPLQTYVFLACQHLSGGLKDKPGKSADFYHSCYSLSGVSVAQHEVDGSTMVLGDAANLLERTDIYYNVLLEKADRKCAYFEALPPLTVSGRQIVCYEGPGAVAWRAHTLTQKGRVEEVDESSSATYTGSVEGRRGGYA